MIIFCNIAMLFNEVKIIRPSGTEPKIKFYVEVKGEMGCRNCYDSANAVADEKIKSVMTSLGI